MDGIPASDSSQRKERRFVLSTKRRVSGPIQSQTIVLSYQSPQERLM
jgi:hypothetical protein